jgi:hypothetical protein
MSNSDQSPHQLVAHADRLRRGRHADRVLAMAAPTVAGVMLAFAAAGRFFGWSRWIPLTALGFAAAGLLLYGFLARRARPTTDAMASVVDRDASLRGELRSAHWFEANGAPDEWTEFHMQKASRRAASVDWAALYPSARAMKQWAGTGVLAVAVIAVSLYVPARASGPDLAAAIGDAELAAALPADVAAKLAALLEDMKKSSLSKNAEQISLEEMKKLLANLDPALQKKLTDLLAKQMEAQNQAKPKEMGEDARPDRAENSAAGLPEDVKWALDDMASRQAQQERQTNPNNPSASSETGQQGQGSQQAEQKMSMSQAASPLVREAASDAASKMMMGGGGPMGGDSGPGAGGKKNEQTGLGNPVLLAQALRKEMVEANADALGENKDKEDRRKKTEQGKSTLGYTRVAPPAAFEPSRSAAPPPVPEARRQLLLNYFIRKK